MATTKRPNSLGKEKRAPVPPATASSNSTITKKTAITKPIITSPLNRSILPCHGQTPNNLRPTLTSRLGPHSQPRTSTTGHASHRETLNRRRHSLEKTQSSSSSSSSNLLRQKQPLPPPSSRSRLQKALLPPGPRVRAAPSSLSAKRTTVSVSSNSSKPVADQRTSKTVVRVGKTQSLQHPKRASSASGVITKRSSVSVITSNKKVIGGGSASSTKARKIIEKSVSAEAEKQVETVKDIEEHVINEVGSICEIEEDVNFFIGNDILLEDEKEISIVEEEIQANVGIAKQEEEEKEEIDQHVKEEENTGIEEISNNESEPEDQGATEAAAEEETAHVSQENHSENFNGDDGNIEEEGNNNTKVEESITVEKQQAGGGKMESDSSLSNDLIEETACRLRETSRRNKVLALAGAFQTVIDHQTM